MSTSTEGAPVAVHLGTFMNTYIIGGSKIVMPVAKQHSAAAAGAQDRNVITMGDGSYACEQLIITHHKDCLL